MNQIIELITTAEQQGIQLWIEANELCFKAPKGALNAELKTALSEHKADIIAFLQDQQEVPEMIDEYRFPLSYGQQALWFIYQEAPDSPAYNMVFALRITDSVDSTVLQRTLHTVIERHAQLRTHFEVNSEGKVWQQVTDTLVELDIIDASQWTWEHLLEQAHRYSQQPFELTQSGLRAALFQQADDCYLLVFVLHHIFGDARSMDIIQQEWLASYAAEIQGQTTYLPILSVTYANYVHDEAKMLNSPQGQQLAKYWHQQLAGEVPILNLPTDHPRPRTQTFTGASYHFQLSQALSVQLTALAQNQKTSLFTLLLGAFQVLLHRYTGQTDIWVGTPTSAGRLPDEFSQLVGYFVNPVVLRSQFTEQSFQQLLTQLHPQVTAARAHQAYPFPHLVQQLQPQRDTGISPLFQVMFSWHNLNSESEVASTGFSYTSIELPQMESQFDLTLTMTKSAAFGCVLNYKADLFAAKRIERMAQHLTLLLEGIVEQPEQSISQLPMLTENEVQQLQAWNDTATDFPKNQTIVDLFEQQVEKTPSNIAVVFETQELSYEKLNRKANQVAHYLMTLGVKPEILVAICVERSIEMVVGLLGILKAGGAYVPIDPNYPPARIGYMLKDSRAPLLLTQSNLKKQLPELKPECVVVCLDEVDFVVQETENPDVNRHVEDLAYVIYTSGSTGKPKGVMVEHKNLVNLSIWHINAFSVQSIDKATLLANSAFDASVWELWPYLMAGACVMPASLNTLIEKDIWRWLNKNKISLSFLPTPIIDNYLANSVSNTTHLRLLLTGGDTLHQSPKLPCPLFNNYGPTENTVVTTSTLVKPNVSPSIGKPIHNVRVYILDAQHQPQPPNIPGELCIAGAGLARGYLNRPELTAEKFIEVELFGKTERIYKTGDLARRLPDGNLEYLGRIDFQVKLRGFRIELGEIEAVLKRHSAVKEAVVTLYEADDNKRLVAYITTASESNELIAFLTDSLKASLPDYMVPSHFTVLDKLPLTPNGKIDRKALPAPSIKISTGTKPATPTEELLASLMAFVLKCEAINREDNFFELGGHSLLATQLIARIRDSFQIELPVRAIFEHPQLSTLAKAIETAAGTVSLPAIEIQSEDSEKILSFAQLRLWFLNQFEDNGSATYNMPAALLLSGELNLAALQQSLHWLQERHASLRTYFPTHAGKATAQIQAIDNIEALRVHDLRLLTDDVLHSEVQNWLNSHALTKFDLATGPLFKAELLQLNETQSVLLLNMHHIISDGWSMGVFIRDWQQAYTAFAQGKQPTLPPLLIQYSDYAAWQRDWLTGKVLQQQVDYWRTQLAGIPELLELPTDKPRPPQQSYQGAHYAHNLSATLTQSVTGLSQQQGVTVFMTLLASFNILLSRYSRQNDISVGSPIANRTHSQTEDIIGFFVNTLVLHSRLQPQQSFIDLLLKTRQTCLEAYAHQDIPYEMLVEQLQPTRSLSHHPLFQVMLVLQNNEAVKLELPGLDITTLNSEYPIAKFDLTLSLVEPDGQFECVWEYATDLFEAETIKRMAGHFEVLLTAIVSHPEQAISQLPMLTEKEIQQLVAWNDTTTDYPVDKTIVDLFEQQVEQTPSNIAVVFEEQSLTYFELNGQANRLAHYLLDLKNQVSLPDNPLIAIAVERSIERVIGLLGILKAGGAYVPIDPSYPAFLIQYLLEDSQAPVLLTQSHLKAQLPTLEPDCVLVCLDEAEWANHPLSNPNIKCQATDLAYIIYTSGSLALPKGVMVEHQALVLHCQAILQQYLINEHDKVLQFASMSFDTSLEQLLVAWLSGASSVLVTTNRLTASDFLAFLHEKAITVADLPPVYWQQILETENLELSHLRILILGGEALPITMARQTVKYFSTLICFNAYGPTEAVITPTVYRVPTQLANVTVCAIGRPRANTRIYILDTQLRPQPPGIPGELCISGHGLARGYLNRPELTAEKFIYVKIFGKTERIYKTGDLARWRFDGNLEYLGRIDLQVKLRGFRIELGEIEAVLSQHEAVKEAVVILYEADDNKRLVAYLTTDSTTNDDVPVVKDWLKNWLPDYMLPSQLVVLDQLPKTPNGKIDRQALSKLSVNTHSLEKWVAPRTDWEKLLADIWAEVLGLEQVGIHNNFFDLVLGKK